MPGDKTIDVTRNEVEERTPSWKVLVYALLSLITIGTPAVLWAGAIKSDTTSAVETQKALLASQERIMSVVSNHAALIAAGDTDRVSLHRQLDSIERTVERLDTKLDKALEKR